MNEAWQKIWHGLATLPWLDQVNMVLGIVGVWLMVRRSLWAFPVGLVAVTVQGLLFFRSRIYADATLQIFFFVALAWGWWHWVHGRGAAPELPVTVMTRRGRLIALGWTAAGTVAWALAAQHWTNSLMPWRDATIAALQVAGQVLQSKKKLENWAFLTAANVVAIPAYVSAALDYTAILFAIYLVLGLVGWVGWARAMNSAGAAAPSPRRDERGGGAASPTESRS